VLARRGTGWREALLRAYYFFRLWRNERLLRLRSRTGKNHTQDAGKQIIRNGNDAVRIDGSSVPPEAEKIIGTKQSFAPARYYHLATLITYTVSTVGLDGYYGLRNGFNRFLQKITRIAGVND
jgi:hypothetical protein